MPTHRQYQEQAPRKPDVLVYNHGSIFTVVPYTTVACEWVEEHVQNEETQWWGGGFCVEPRYLENLLHGMAEDGLRIRTQRETNGIFLRQS